ncbi:MAG TPA: hypothetical protein PKD85_22930 [Saprospiraceae bacterium]|nr:hypothetical protein [Saprospiraceae bacterium]
MNFNFDKYICELVKGSRYFNRSCLGNENVFRYNAIGPALERKKNITCIIGIYSKENYKRAISSEERLGVEIGLLEKVTAYSNVVNGYGIVYGSFKTQITIEN